MFKNDTVRLRHILDSAQEAIQFTQGRSRMDLDGDRMFSHSLVRLLEIIGEAARGVSKEFREDHPDLPWRKMVGMRDRLIHGYFDINLDVVWETVNNDLPYLVSRIEDILNSE